MKFTGLQAESLYGQQPSPFDLRSGIGGSIGGLVVNDGIESVEVSHSRLFVVTMAGSKLLLDVYAMGGHLTADCFTHLHSERVKLRTQILSINTSHFVHLSAGL